RHLSLLSEFAVNRQALLQKGLCVVRSPGGLKGRPHPSEHRRGTGAIADLAEDAKARLEQLQGPLVVADEPGRSARRLQRSRTKRRRSGRPCERLLEPGEA